jgi:3-methylcrotonyl-CoA carboxylase alpha subunit
MFTSLLIANRGEIACRIIDTARKLAVRTIAVYSDADASARHVRLAHHAVRLGPAAASESYLRVDKLLAVAKEVGAEAIHPGYGFLSENPELAEACAESGIVFVGPSSEAIRAMGSKSVAKALMQKFGVPLTPGYHGDDQSVDTLARQAARIGFPVLIKSSAGGGGKGMRRVDHAADFEMALTACKREAAASFKSDHVLVEKYVDRPRHIEVQVFGDRHGNCIHLFERDCSVQRRYQKVIEEAPAPGMTAELRAAMGQAAVRAARAVDYVGAGTVEFIVDSRGSFSFMEMNTRLQVEHPVTESVTGLDLVEWQLRVAAGEVLPLTQDQLSLRGHAIEARIYAENPRSGFMPSVGRLLHLKPPVPSPWLRIDTGVEAGDAIGSYYDPLIAKLIVWGADRRQALARLGQALDAYEIVGVSSNVEFLGRLVRCRSFVAADLDTGLIEREHTTLLPDAQPPTHPVWCIAASRELARRALEAEKEAGWPWAALDGWRLDALAAQIVALRCGEEQHEVLATWLGRGHYALSSSGLALPPTTVAFELLPRDQMQVTVGPAAFRVTAVAEGATIHLFLEGCHWQLEVVDPLATEADDAAELGSGLVAHIPGRVVAHLVREGASVEKGAPLLVLEAMKMELTISAPHAGVVRRFIYGVGEQVSEGARLLDLDAAGTS